MTRHSVPVSRAFEEATLRIGVGDILPLREVPASVKKSIKYGQIAASIREVGIIEPPVVVRDREEPDRYHILDGHLRLEILRDQGTTEVVCLVATEDEAFTYNKRVSRIAIIQEHKMILNAIRKGVPEERLARALNVNISSIRAKRNLLIGMCPEAVELLRDKHVPLNAFTELRKMKPMRQIEAAELMVAMNRYSTGYAKSLVAASPEDQLLAGRRKAVKGLTSDQIALMERESASLDREFRLVEQSYGTDHLDLVLATGYLNRLLDNARIVRHLAQHHAALLDEFQKIADIPNAA
ncbi:ParB N-terminal domain-containing protein [Sphingomonas sp. IC-11]|uniref:plasmid partitioning protein RepB C-terminal domain-containing protein n=1 Tax=Sphingomonas sp. IC-11 TaxID=2898528 RepID=UPI001E2F73F9|nr:plasmid partitioning protein RepB C-terminal domain-containing protein [Sphingomonas sp. IC-11]MCD2316701.1 ParB N-terminal domain-containing protein [Sphingomonas sp. IC-11]